MEVLLKKYVTSGDFQKKFGIFKRQAFEAPVHITVHGQPSLVLMSARHYEAMRVRAERVDAPQEA